MDTESSKVCLLAWIATKGILMEENSFNKSLSSGLGFLSYPGGGNGKQRDMAQNSTLS